MKKYLINTVWVLMAVMTMSACSKEELVEEIKELDPTGEIAVKSEITVDGVDVTNTRAATEAGYTTGDGLYDKGDEVIVAAFANDGYELTAFYDKEYPTTNLGSSYDFKAEIPRTFKAEFRRNAEFIAVGKGGKIFTSTKTSKTVVQVGTSDWNAVVSGSGKYVAVGNSGNITTSTDGRVWTAPQKVGNNAWLSITYGNGKFVAVGSSGYSTTSTNGLTWSTPKTPDTAWKYTWKAVTFGNNKFVAAGTNENRDAFTMVSPDGINWTESAKLGVITDLNSVTYGNGVFSAGVNKYIVSSMGGLTWTYRTGYYNCKDIVFGKDKFVAVGKGGDIAYSLDAINWSRSTTFSGINDYNWHNAIYGNGAFVTVARLNNTEYFISSTDGITWTTPKQLKDESGQALNMEINDICSIMPPDTGKTFHFKTADPLGRLDWWRDRGDQFFSYTFTRSELGYNYDYVVTHDTNHSGWKWLVDGKEVINAGQDVDLVMSPEIYDRYPDNTTFTYDHLGGNPGTETYTITAKAARWSSPNWLQDVGESKVGFDRADLSSEKTIQATRGETLTIYAQGADGFHPYPNDTDHWYYKVLGFYNAGHVAYKLGTPNNGGADSYTFTVSGDMTIYVDFQYIS